MGQKRGITTKTCISEEERNDTMTPILQDDEEVSPHDFLDLLKEDRLILVTEDDPEKLLFDRESIEHLQNEVSSTLKILSMCQNLLLRSKHEK